MSNPLYTVVVWNPVRAPLDWTRGLVETALGRKSGDCVEPVDDDSFAEAFSVLTQAVARGRNCRLAFLVVRELVILAQASVRGFLERREAARQRKQRVGELRAQVRKTQTSRSGHTGRAEDAA